MSCILKRNISLADSHDHGVDNIIPIRLVSRLIFSKGKTMGRKCCVTNCRGNYESNSKEKVFRLPADENERKRWQSIIPKDNTPDTKDAIVCERHWLNSFETVIHYGKQRPLHFFLVLNQICFQHLFLSQEKPFDLCQKCGANWLMR